MLAPHPFLDLGDLVQNSGLDRRQRRCLAGRTGEGPCYADLVDALDQSNRKLRAQRSHSPTPGLTGCGIPKAIRLKVVPRIIEKSLRTLIVEIETSWSRQREQWCNSSIE